MVAKRSISLPDELVIRIDDAATREGVSFSAWLARAAEQDLKFRDGEAGLAAYEEASGALDADERQASEAVLRRVLSGMGVRVSRSRRR